MKAERTRLADKSTLKHRGNVTRRSYIENPITRLLALTAFVAGGLAAPAVHRLHHAIESRDVVTHLSMFDGHAHGDDELLSYPLPRSDFREPYCVLCNVVFPSLEDDGQITVTTDGEQDRMPAPPTDHTAGERAFRGRAPPTLI